MQTHTDSHTLLHIQSHLSSSTCVFAPVRRLSLQRKYPRCKQSRLQNQACFHGAISAQRTNTHLSSQEACLTGEIYLPHINEKRALSFLIRLLGYHLRRGAGAIFNHPVLPHAELVAFDGCCIIIWILIKDLYINLRPPTVIVNFQ